MSLFNIQDGIIKSSLVQQIQDRGNDIARAAEAARVGQHAEEARQASEFVAATQEAENHGIRQEQERKRQERRRRQKRSPSETDSEDESPKPPPPQPRITHGADGRPHINIVV